MPQRLTTILAFLGLVACGGCEHEEKNDATQPLPSATTRECSAAWDASPAARKNCWKSADGPGPKRYGGECAGEACSPQRTPPPPQSASELAVSAKAACQAFLDSARTCLGSMLDESSLAEAMAGHQLTVDHAKRSALSSAQLAKICRDLRKGMDRTCAVQKRMMFSDLVEGGLVDIDGDGIDDMISRVYRIEKMQPRYYLGAYSGADLKLLWTSQSFGTQLQFLHTAMVGDQILALDDRAKAHLIDPATGKELRVIQLTDRAHQLCRSPDGQSAWLELLDKRQLLIDASHQIARPHPRPASCSPRLLYRRGLPNCAPDSAGQTCQKPAKRVRRPDFSADHILQRGSVAIAVGYRKPGSKTPMVGAVEPHSGAIRWLREVPGENRFAAHEGPPEAVALAGDTVYVLYQAATLRLAAIGAARGETLWDVHVAGNSSASSRPLVVTQSRVYVHGDFEVIVVERRDGKHIHRLTR